MAVAVIEAGEDAAPSQIDLFRLLLCKRKDFFFASQSGDAIPLYKHGFF